MTSQDVYVKGLVYSRPQDIKELEPFMSSDYLIWVDRWGCHYSAIASAQELGPVIFPSASPSLEE